MPSHKQIRKAADEKPGRQKRLLPSDKDLKSAREKLPLFPVIEIRKIVEGQTSSDPNVRDFLTIKAVQQELRNQVSSIFAGLGCRDHDWQGAFLKLALLHHNVGRLGLTRQPSRTSAATWSPEATLLLLRAVEHLVRSGMTQQAALAKIAGDPRYSKSFPYREQRPGQKIAGVPTSKARLAALTRKFHRLQREFASSTWDQAIGRGASELEWLLTTLDISVAKPR